MVKSLGAEEPAMRQKAYALDIFRGNKYWKYVNLCHSKIPIQQLSRRSCGISFDLFPVFAEHWDFADLRSTENFRQELEETGLSVSLSYPGANYGAQWAPRCASILPTISCMMRAFPVSRKFSHTIDSVLIFCYFFFVAVHVDTTLIT